MALFRCGKCGHMREVGNDYIGKSVKCPKCNQGAKIYETVAFFNALIKKHMALKNELQNLQQITTVEDSPEVLLVEDFSLEEIDIYNTKSLTQSEQYQPILQWFENHHILIELNPEAFDTTGFFDEIALSIGNNFDLFQFITEQIKYIQNKSYTNVKLDVSKKTPKEIQKTTAFCKEMYDYSFVAKFFYQKKDKIIRLTLQTAPRIRKFFNGIWMEWFILMKLLEYFRDNKVNASCIRGPKITFPDGESNELDIFLLTAKNIPVCIECKSGEFRHDIDKYLTLRKKLNFTKEQFVLCVFGLSDEQTHGMTSMYDLTFANEKNFMSHLEKIV